MKISKKRKANHNKYSVFTIVELVVVIAGLSALSAFAIPSVISSIKLSKIEEAKAIMNGYVSECLGKYRVSTDSNEFYKNARPEVDEIKLATLGYKIDGNKDKCEYIALVPSDDNDEFRYSFDFRMGDDDKTNTIKVLKTGIPAAVERTLNSCRGWAGANCSLSAEKAAEFAAAAALAAKKNECITKYNNYKIENGEGNTITWNPETKNCDKVVWLFNKTPVSGEDAYNALVKQKFGEVCDIWKNNKKQSNYISKKDTSGLGIGETIPECNKAKYWFHSGIAYTSEVEWNKFNLDYQLQACNRSKTDAIRNGHKGAFTYGPHKIPSPPCGRQVYLCNGTEYSSNAEYQASPCGAPPPPPPPPPKPPRCEGVSYTNWCNWGSYINSYDCRCAPGGIWNR